METPGNKYRKTLNGNWKPAISPIILEVSQMASTKMMRALHVFFFFCVPRARFYIWVSVFSAGDVENSCLTLCIHHFPKYHVWYPCEMFRLL